MRAKETDQGVLPIYVSTAQRLAGILSILNLLDNKPGVCETTDEERRLVRNHIDDLNDVEKGWVF